MIRDFFTVVKLKVKYAINTTFYYSKSSLFTQKQDSISMDNIFDLLFKSFSISFIKKFLMSFVLILVFAVIPLLFLFDLNINNLASIIIFFSVCISLLYSPLNEFTEDTLYAVEYLKINAQKYFISNYIIKLFIDVMIFFTSLVAFDFFLSYDLLNITNICFLTMNYLLIRNIGIFVNLKFHKNSKYTKLSSLIFLVAGYMLLYFKVIISLSYYRFILIILIVLSLCSMLGIINYCYYEDFYSFLHEKYKRKKVKLKQYENKKLSNQMADINVVKCENPYRNFLNIYDKRYRKINHNKVEIAPLLIFIIIIYLAFSMMNDLSLKEVIYSNFYYNMPFFILILCLINKDKNLVKNLYFKCDIFMTTHNFYQTYSFAIKMYYEKLKYLIRKNLLKTNVLACSLMILYYLTGFEISLIEYLTIFISINMIMILISNYYLTVYYVCNPFKNNFEKLNPINFFILYFPYFIALYMMNCIIPILTFGFYTLIIFVISLILNYFLVNYILKKQ